MAVTRVTCGPDHSGSRSVVQTERAVITSQHAMIFNVTLICIFIRGGGVTMWINRWVCFHHTPTSGFEYEYATNAPPDIQRMVDAPMHSTPYPDPPTLSGRLGPNLLPPRPRSSSVPPTPKTVQRMATLHASNRDSYPPISPARATAMDPQSEADTPSPKRSQEEAGGVASGAPLS